MTALETLQRYWGYDRFRPMQEEIISAALGGGDVLANGELAVGDEHVEHVGLRIFGFELGFRNHAEPHPLWVCGPGARCVPKRRGSGALPDAALRGSCVTPRETYGLKRFPCAGG